ncbi:MAG TPA: hypothetical protein VFS68_11680, partial [Candidatus Udaeobacter sp.]|nr:hypothetical protein [Candidatus Udaeobacter sp.]
MKFLDFPIFLDLSRALDPLKTPKTWRIVQIAMWACYLPKPARTRPLFSRSFLEFFDAANKKGSFLTQEGAAS